MTSRLKIGGVMIGSPFILAPMAGYTDSAFRSICMRFHCGMTYTEVANAESLARGSKRTLHLFESGPEEHPVVAHIYGSNPEILAKAAKVIAGLKRFDFIDINCGCPLRKIVAKGAGAALIRDPEKIAEIVRSVRGAVDLPVMIKTRIGFAPDRLNVTDIAHAVAEAGAAGIAVHGRFAANVHSGPSDWNAIAKLKSETGIPVIGNGGVGNAEEAVRLLEQTGVDGVMIGRAAVGRPWLFAEAYSLLTGGRFTPPSPEERGQLILEHLENLVALKTMDHKYKRKSALSPDQAAVLHFRSHLYRYLQGLPGWPIVRKNLQEVRTRKDVLDAVSTAFFKS